MNSYSISTDKRRWGSELYNIAMILSHGAYKIWKHGNKITYGDSWSNSEWDID